MILLIFYLLISSSLCQIIDKTYTLVGDCPDVKFQENLDGTKFSGLWYNIASYASDNRTVNYCTTMEFQEDNMGFTLREIFIDSSVENINRSQNSFSARVDPTFDAGNRGKFIVSLGNGEKVLQFPLFILTTDYEDFAILYTCKSTGRKAKMHYMFVWVLTRSKEPLEGEHLQKIEKAISNYPELAVNRPSFTFQDFSDAACAFKTKKEIDFSAGNFW